MQKTQKEAREYAKWLANLHKAVFHVVKLAPAEPGSGRHTHRITGRFYGGIRDKELADWLEDGHEFLETVWPE